MSGTAWHEDSKFLKLRKKWYDKLKKEGFEDIEHIDWVDGSSGNLTNGFSKMDAVRRGSTRLQSSYDYYALARQFNWILASPPPKGSRQHPCSDLECLRTARKTTKKLVNLNKIRRLWALHAEGLSATEISGKLKIGRKLVQAIINELAEKMMAQAALEWDDDRYEETLTINDQVMDLINDAIRNSY